MPKPDIDTDLIERLADLLGRSGLSEIEIEQDSTRIRVVRQVAATIEVASPATAPASQTMPAQAPQTAVDHATHAASSDDHHPGAIKSPIVGTVYLAPEPSAPTFVRPGDQVEEGQTLLIIEAMKVMNAIRAPKKGRVIKILVENEAPVEFGETLLILE